MAIREHRRVGIQERVNDSAEGSCSLAVDNADVQNTPTQTFLDVFGHQRFHILRREGVEIKGAINRQFERFVVHETNITSSNAERARLGTRQR